MKPIVLLLFLRVSKTYRTYSKKFESGTKMWKKALLPVKQGARVPYKIVNLGQYRKKGF